MKQLLSLLIFLVCISSSFAKSPSKAGGEFFIYPDPSGWGDVRVADVLKVSRSVGQTLMKHFPDKKLNPILLKNDKEGPRVNYERGDQNEYIMLVDISGRHWSKLVYQFSHEMSHILSNYGNKSGKNQWFGESLCETMSLYALDELSVTWKTNPPYPNWKSYAKSHRSYLDNELAKKHRIINEPIAKWFEQNKNKLRNDPYIRAKNEVIGTAIYRLIKEGKFKIPSIRYLNRGSNNADKSFKEYLKDWYDYSPKAYKDSVNNVAKLFAMEF